MYKPTEPIRCPKCGTTVNVNTSMILTSNPPCYEWICPNCGEKGNTKHGDVKSDYKLNNVINHFDTLFRTSVRCDICDEEFENDGHNICPKCREAVMKVRKNIYDAQHNIGSYGCTVYRNSFNQPKVTVDDTVCGEGSVSVSSRKAIDGDIKLTIQGDEIE